LTASTALDREYDPERDRSERRALLFRRLGWLVTLPLLLVAALRLVAHDATMELIMLNAFTAWLYLPAWLILPAALRARSWRLSAASAVLVLLHLAWVDPRGLVAAKLPSLPASAARVRVMSANLLMVNEDTAGIAGEILAASPDILLVQEQAPQWRERFERDDFVRALPYRSSVTQVDSFGIGIYTRVPHVAEQLDIAGFPAFRADVPLAAATLRVFNFHTMPPRAPQYVATWNEMMARIVALVAERSGPVLLGGDLNTTPHHAWFARLLATGLTSAHEARGRTLATSWPNGHFPAPPIRLDHFFISHQLVTLDVSEGEGRGSDHRPIIADFALVR
jgi:endonuclease/exonuclease/phosphatase (EEP) superfamily protein YafD